ncbi:MAG: hypothetical protein LBB82_09560 [Treponema sp.]|jgi:hypothetical protein|nr:hypothetical protein [Treponema sp.]
MSYQEKRYKLREGFKLLNPEQRSEILGMAEALYYCQMDEKIAKKKRKTTAAPKQKARGVLAFRAG